MQIQNKIKGKKMFHIFENKYKHNEKIKFEDCNNCGYNACYVDSACLSEASIVKY